MTCLYAPSTLADFRAVIEGCAIAAGGRDWRSAFTLGLGTVLVFGGLFLVVGLALRAATR